MPVAWGSDSAQFSAEGQGFMSVKYFYLDTSQTLSLGARFSQIIKIRLFFDNE
jgi:hypothetical protein